MPASGPLHMLFPLPKTLSCKSCNKVIHNELPTKYMDRKEQSREAAIGLTKHKRKRPEPVWKDVWRGWDER